MKMKSWRLESGERCNASQSTWSELEEHGVLGGLGESPWPARQPVWGPRVIL